MHDPWEIGKDQPLTQALMGAYADVYGKAPEQFDFWDFGTNAITPVAMGVPTIGFGPGEYKLAPLRERLGLDQNSRVLCLSTEGATDQANYRRVVWSLDVDDLI